MYVSNSFSSSTSSERARNVVVLLFYSSAIVVGIIKYLQREKEDVEEEKEFEAYINIKQESFKFSRYYRMQHVKRQLEEISEKKKVEMAQESFTDVASEEHEVECEIFQETFPMIDSMKLDSFEVDEGKTIVSSQKETLISNLNDNGISCVLSSSAPADVGLARNSLV